MSGSGFLHTPAQLTTQLSTHTPALLKRAVSSLGSSINRLSHRDSFRSVESYDRIQRLSVITNNRAYRQVRPDRQSALDRASMHAAVNELAMSGGSVKADELSFVKSLGEGAFARVELWRLRKDCLERLTANGANRALLRNRGRVAVKIMKRWVVDPESAERGIHRQVRTPDQWFADFNAEAVLIQSIKSPFVVSSFGRVLPTHSKGDAMFMQAHHGTGHTADLPEFPH